MRGDQLARQWMIIRTLEARQYGVTARELAAEVGCSVRTLYRDMDALEYAGFPIIRDEETHRFSWMEGHRFRVPEVFTPSELMSLWLYRDLLKALKGTAWYESLESLFRKVRTVLPPGALNYMERIQTGFSVGLKPYKEYGRLREIINQVNQGILDRRSLEIAYHSLEAEGESLRKIDPYHLWFFDGTFYLIAYCHLRREVRMFVLDRMRLVRVGEEAFEIQPGFDLDEYLRHSFKVKRGERLNRVRVRISPAWARWVGERIWHESQESRRLPDGSLELAFEVAGLSEIRMWVMSLGGEAEVLEPRELRELVLEEAGRMAGRYGPAGKAAETAGRDG